MTDRVIVFIDYENLRFSALDRFHRVGATRTDGSPVKQPSAAAANDAQASAWSRNPLVHVMRRDLRYPPNYPLAAAQEKGVDVALSIDFVRLAIEEVYDAGIIVSRDTDLLPALETVVDLRLARVEVAAWHKASRLNFPGSLLPWCHRLDQRDYESVRDTTDYLKGRP